MFYSAVIYIRSMTEQDNTLGKVYIQARPDFKTIKPYLYRNYDSIKLGRLIYLHQSSHSKIHMPFLTKQEGEELKQNLKILLDKDYFKGHEENLKYIILILAKEYLDEHLIVRLNNQQSTKRVETFIDQFNELFRNESKRFSVSFKEIDEKTINITFKDQLVTDWIIKILRDAITQGKVPLTIGTQLFGAHITASTSDRKYHYYKRDIPLEAYEIVEPETIYTQTVAKICVPLLAYINNETNFKKRSQKYWSLAQLGFLIDVLILLGFYESQDKKYKIGEKNPPVADKKYLQRTLINKINQGYLIVKSGTLAPDL